MGLAVYFYWLEVPQVSANIGSLWFYTIVLVPDVDSYLSLDRHPINIRGFHYGHPTQFLLMMLVEIM